MLRSKLEFKLKFFSSTIWWLVFDLGFGGWRNLPGFGDWCLDLGFGVGCAARCLGLRVIKGLGLVFIDDCFTQLWA